MKNGKTIIVFRFSALGDVAMCFPVMGRVLTDNPQLSIVFVTESELALLAENVPGLSVFPVDIENHYRGIGGMIKLFVKLKQQFPGAVVADLHDVLRSKILVALFRLNGTKAAVIDKGKSEKEEVTRRDSKVLKQLPSTFDRYLDVFRQLGCHVMGRDLPVFKIRPLELVNYDVFTGVRGTKWIGISPFSAYRGKTYPISKMEKVIAGLSNLEGYQVFLFGRGDKKTRWFFDNIVMRNPGVISLAGILPLESQLSVIAKLTLMVSMDSSILHLASLFGVPVVSVWGATHPFVGFSGNKQPAEYAVQLEMPCRPCSVHGKEPCWRKDYACLEAIEPTMIIERVMKVLEIQVRR